MHVLPAKHGMYRLRNQINVSPAKLMHRIRNKTHISQVKHSQKMVSQTKQRHVSPAILHTVHECCFVCVTKHVTPAKQYVSPAKHDMYRLRNTCMFRLRNICIVYETVYIVYYLGNMIMQEHWAVIVSCHVS